MFIADFQFHCLCTPSLAVNGGSGRQNRRFRITPTVVRRGQTDWLRRLLCGNLGGTSRAWDIILWHPTLLGPLGSPPLQHCIAPCSPCQSGRMYCGPAGMMAWSVRRRWAWSVRRRCEIEGQLFLIGGMASVSFGSTYTQNDLPGENCVDSRPSLCRMRRRVSGVHGS